ncbi:hypothetical protein TRFO_08181 [Tritrichomonas foetus]|uniref:Uncharacterized protein n=1 Tax=Tritrichomonas foetus TaxID=1144522 RepID=A0A1J4JLA6_9EUKA|nr:hypothetical protein TRFO_08181 [Tritrichomonas foetus]|eukprot:OHS99878.1 hypothetical protein TRFO_08181 [Tritrichomonas foetus]
MRQIVSLLNKMMSHSKRIIHFYILIFSYNISNIKTVELHSICSTTPLMSSIFSYKLIHKSQSLFNSSVFINDHPFKTIADSLSAESEIAREFFNNNPNSPLRVKVLRWNDSFSSSLLKDFFNGNEIFFNLENLGFLYSFAQTMKINSLKRVLDKFQYFISSFKKNIQTASEIENLFEIEETIFQLTEENIQDTAELCVLSVNENRINLPEIAHCILGLCIYKQNLIKASLDLVNTINQTFPKFSGLFYGIIKKCETVSDDFKNEREYLLSVINNHPRKNKSAEDFLFTVIKNDDITAFQEITSSPKFDFSMTISIPAQYCVTCDMEKCFTNIYNPTIKELHPDILDLFSTSILFTSFQIFKYLLHSEYFYLMNHDFYHNIDHALAIYGGNTQIIHILDDKERFEKAPIKFHSDLLKMAVKGHHGELLEWLIETKHLILDNFCGLELEAILLGSYSIIYNLMTHCYKLYEIFEYSVQYGIDNIVQLFFSTRAFNVHNPEKLLEYAVLNQHINIIKILLSNCKFNDNELNIFYDAVSTKCEEIVELITKANMFDVNKVYKKSTPLILACQMNLSEIVNILLTIENIDINRKVIDDAPLHIAVKGKMMEIIKSLIADPRCDVNLRDNSYGFSPLHIACQNNCSEIVEILLKCPKINIQITDSVVLFYY